MGSVDEIGHDDQQLFEAKGIPLPTTTRSDPNRTARTPTLPTWRRFAITTALALLVLHQAGVFTPQAAYHPLMKSFGAMTHELAVKALDEHPRIHISMKDEHEARRAREKVFLTVPDAEIAREVSHLFTAQQHIAGTEQDRLSALSVKEQFERNLGLKISKPEENVFEAGSEQSRRALLGVYSKRSCRGHSHHSPHYPKHHHSHHHRHNIINSITSFFKTLTTRTRMGVPTVPSHHSSSAPRVWVDTYYPWLNYPVSSALTLTPPSATEPSFVASLKEDVLNEDPTSGFGPATFHGLSKNGTARGQLVYVGRGTHAEFEAMKARGIDFTGKIVIAQYSGSFRGLKAQAAAEYGAVGVLIYSDPVSDYNITVENNVAAYPDGPARQPSSVQRGSVQFLSIYPGDPLTPGTPAYENATRLSEDDPTINIPSIPSLPISYEDAIPLLKSLNGHGWKNEDREGWKEGGLRYRGVEYFSGPGEDVVELTNIMDGGVTKIWNTYAIIPGQSSELIVLGNHNDAWTFGAGDPNSGTATMHEVVRGFGQLMKHGWRPKRSILIASWDAEEYGLIGSTEFGEDYSEYLKEHVVAYLNVDVSVAGSEFGLRASPSLGDLLKEVSSRVQDPDQKDRSLLQRIEANVDRAGDGRFDCAAIGTPSESVKGSGGSVVSPLGSGSDYTVFLQHLGIASSDTSFSPRPGDPIYHYHSNYDSAFWMDKYGDPTFERHIAVSKVLGLAALRLVDEVVLPINVSAYAHELGAYLNKVPVDLVEDRSKRASLAKALREVATAVTKIQTRAAELDEETRVAETELASAQETYSIHQNLLDRVAILSREAKPYRQDSRALSLARLKLIKTHLHIRSINRRRRTFEQGFIDDEGLELRPWYKNVVVAPGRRLGYGATTLPGLTEALTLDHDADRAREEAQRLVRIFNKVAKNLKKK